MDEHWTLLSDCISDRSYKYIREFVQPIYAGYCDDVRQQSAERKSPQGGSWTCQVTTIFHKVGFPVLMPSNITEIYCIPCLSPIIQNLGLHNNVVTLQKVQYELKVFLLALKMPITTTADDMFVVYFLIFGEIRLAITCESSACR